MRESSYRINDRSRREKISSRKLLNHVTVSKTDFIESSFLEIAIVKDDTKGMKYNQIMKQIISIHG